MNASLTPMMTNNPESTAHTLQRGLILFFTLTLGWMGLCGGVAILVAHGFMTFPLSPVALLGVGGLMPMLAALGAAGYEAGWAGMRILLGQLARWRLPQGGRWYAITLIGMALIVLLAQLLNLVLGGKWPPSPPATTWQTLPVLAVVYLIIAIIEEVGWRGYALPRLQLHYGGLAASLILGMIWGCWHLPQWFIPATGQADKWSFGVFLLHTVAFSVLLTWLYNHSAGSLWPVILAHAAFNLFPEPWAAAWQSLPVEQRGLYPVILITLVEAVIVVLLVRRIGVRLDQPQRLTVALLPALLALALGLTPSIPAAAQTTPTTPDFAAIDAYLATQMQELSIPGLALGIVQDNQIVHLKGFGIADPSGRAVTAQTPFQLASLGKPITGMAVMQLVEQGKLELDAPVQRYLPWFRAADEVASARITVRHLLYHTSGLPGTIGMEYALRGDNRPDALEARMREVSTVQLNHPVGATYEYANAGYMLLGLLIQQASGQPYADYLHEYIFAPLEMQQSFTELADAKAHGLATGYRYWFGVPTPGEMAVDRAILPAGGHMSASVEDMTHFLIANLNGGRYDDAALLSPASIAEMQRPVVPIKSQIGADEFYAMDWGVSQIGGTAVVMKGGDNADFKTNMVLVPDQHLGVVVLFNANDRSAASFGDLRIPLLAYHVVELLLGQPLTVSPVSQVPKIINGVLLLITAIQLGGMVLTLVRLRRWQNGRSQPQSQGARLWQIGLPLVLNLAWGGFALVVMPRLIGAPLSFIQYIAPTVGYTLLVSGVVALGWGVVRTVLAYLALRTPNPATSSLAGAPVSEPLKL